MDDGTLPDSTGQPSITGGGNRAPFSSETATATAWGLMPSYREDGSARGALGALESNIASMSATPIPNHSEANRQWIAIGTVIGFISLTILYCSIWLLMRARRRRRANANKRPVSIFKLKLPERDSLQGATKHSSESWASCKEDTASAYLDEKLYFDGTISRPPRPFFLNLHDDGSDGYYLPCMPYRKSGVGNTP